MSYKNFNPCQNADREAYYEGFDNIFSKVPHFKSYQFWLLIVSGWTCIIGGQVQTGSIILQARPENFRCKNQIDEKFGVNFTAHAFASTETHCSAWDIDWSATCPNATSATDFEACFAERRVENQVCSDCEEYVYANDNTFTETAVRSGPELETQKIRLSI